MTEIVSPVLPDCLALDWEANQTLQQRHAELQQTSLSNYAALMLPVQQSAEGLHYVDTIQDIQQPLDDEAHAVVVPIPFATGWRPHMAAKIDLLNAALGGGKRIVALPNSTQQTRATQYTRQERTQLATGSYGPLEEKVLRLLDHKKITRVSIAGYSQGAAVGVHIARAVAEHGMHDLEAAALSDMPTVVTRSLGKLGLDFVKTGATAYQRSMDETGLALLRQSVEQPTFRGSQRDLLQYAATIAMTENMAMVRSMRHASFGSALLQAATQSEARFGLLRLQQSTVTPAVEYQQMVDAVTDYFPDRVTSLEIPGYGHEFGDHSVALALVEARTLIKS